MWSDGTFTWGGTTPTPSGPFKYGVGPVPPSDPFANPIGPQAVNVPDSPEWTSWEVPPGMMNDAYQKNLKFYDNLNKGIVEGDRIPLLPDANVMQGSVLDAQPKKGIMERISDFFFTPAGAAEIDSSKLPEGDPFRSKFDVIDVYNQWPDYKGLREQGQDYLDPPNNLSAALYNTPDGAIPYWGADQYNYNQGMLNTPQDPIIINFADGGRIGYANGGLASLFTRRG